MEEPVETGPGAEQVASTSESTTDELPAEGATGEKRRGFARGLINIATARWQKLKGALFGIRRAVALAQDDEKTFQKDSKTALLLAELGELDVKLEVEEVKELKSINYLQQGDASAYTNEALKKRHDIRADPVMIQSVHAWWDWLPKTEAVTLSQPIYSAMVVIVQLVLLPKYGLKPDKQYDPAEDWEHDRKDEEEMSFPNFFDAMFELADMWSDSVSAGDYAELLRDLLWDVRDLEDTKHVFSKLLTKFGYIKPDPPPEPEYPADPPPAPKEKTKKHKDKGDRAATPEPPPPLDPLLPLTPQPEASPPSKTPPPKTPPPKTPPPKAPPATPPKASSKPEPPPAKPPPKTPPKPSPPQTPPPEPQAPPPTPPPLPTPQPHHYPQPPHPISSLPPPPEPSPPEESTSPEPWSGEDTPPPAAPELPPSESPPSSPSPRSPSNPKPQSRVKAFSQSLNWQARKKDSPPPEVKFKYRAPIRPVVRPVTVQGVEYGKPIYSEDITDKSLMLAKGPQELKTGTIDFGADNYEAIRVAYDEYMSAVRDQHQSTFPPPPPITTRA